MLSSLQSWRDNTDSPFLAGIEFEEPVQQLFGIPIEVTRSPRSKRFKTGPLVFLGEHSSPRLLECIHCLSPPHAPGLLEMPMEILVHIFSYTRPHEFVLPFVCTTFAKASSLLKSAQTTLPSRHRQHESHPYDVHQHPHGRRPSFNVSTRFILWAHRNRLTACAMPAVCYWGNVDALVHLMRIEGISSVRAFERLCFEACAAGHAGVLATLFHHRTSAIVGTGHGECGAAWTCPFEFALNSGPLVHKCDVACQVACVKAAAWHGRIGWLDWLAHKTSLDQCTFVSIISGVANECDNVDILDWMLRRGFRWNPSIVLDAIRIGNMDVVVWAERNNLPWDVRAGMELASLCDTPKCDHQTIASYIRWTHSNLIM